MSRFTGKTVFVTGASSGLGAATARLFADEGASVFGIGRNEAALDELCQYAGNIAVHAAELGDSEQCRQAIAACVDQFGRLDVLVNTAGKHNLRHSTEVSDSDWQQDLAVNISGPFYLCRAAIPHLLEAKGNIVNVASIAGLTGQPYSAGYCSAKHALIGLTRSLALEYIHSDLRVNVICPGGMDTPQVHNFSFPENADIELVMRSGGLRGMMPAEEVASVIAFLASPDASAIHGAVYPVDRGKMVG
ncbi:MAG: SDR family NAD(P)-dependent oxidoreductase [Pseudomonadales bacterium]